MTQFASRIVNTDPLPSRPEYTLFPSNPVNPILLDVRTYHEYYKLSWREILKQFRYVHHAAGHYITNDWERIADPEMLEHAEKVLVRLASASQTD